MDKLRDRRISLIYMEILRFAQNDMLLVQVFKQSLKPAATRITSTYNAIRVKRLGSDCEVSELRQVLFGAFV